MNDAAARPGLWGKLRQMRTAFVLLCLIAAGALIGTVLPQGLPPEEYASRYGAFAGGLVVRLGLGHVHSAVWFLLLIALLLLSLAACSGRLWREARARWRGPGAEAAMQRLQSPTHTTRSPLAPEQACAALAAVAGRHGLRHVPLAADGAPQVLYLVRHRASAWGQMLAHYAVFLIALGALLGSLPRLSLDRQVMVPEGDTYHADDGALPFDVRVDGFRVLRQPGTDEVQNYVSQVVLLADGRELTRGEVSVNHPLRCRGVFISQVSWTLGEARVSVSRAGRTTPLAFPLARNADPAGGVWGVPRESWAAALPGERAALVATGFYADSADENGAAMGRDSEFLGRPALHLTFVSIPQGDRAAGQRRHNLDEIGWLLPGMSRPLPGGGDVRFLGVTQVTGLGLRRDSGLPLVWAGFIVCLVGLTLIFYLPLHRSVLSCAADDAGGTTVRWATYGQGPEAAPTGLWADMLQAVGAYATEGAPDA